MTFYMLDLLLMKGKNMEKKLISQVLSLKKSYKEKNKVCNGDILTK